jgi:hypothetical protein
VSGSAAVIADCTGGADQKWRLNANGTIVGVQSGKCPDVNGASTADGALVIVYTCGGASNRTWQRPLGLSTTDDEQAAEKRSGSSFRLPLR